jgi:hypothetical protein
VNSTPRIVIIVAVIVAAGLGGYLWWQHQHRPLVPAPAPVAAPAPPVPAAPPTPPRPPAEPAIRHPVASGRDKLPGLDESDGYIKNALLELLGKKSALSFLVLDGFARRFVATVNNLATDNAASQSWPVNRTDGRFQVDAPTGSGVISSQNAARYRPFVDFVAGVDSRRAVSLYVRLYPLFQRAYEDLGFPGKYFNDRVIEVIDNLQATPDVTGPIKVKTVAADGTPVAPGPGRLYVFEDPALESATVGQKILLRVGPDNARKLKAKLSEVRERLLQNAGGTAPR